MSSNPSSTMRKLEIMRKQSQSIWGETVKNHSSELEEMIQWISSIHQWKNMLQPKDLEPADLLSEASLDIFACINSILNGYYRQGMFSLRSCLEMVLSFVYFVDYPLEYKRWRDAKGKEADTKVGKWLAEEGFLTKHYIEYFVPKDNVLNGLHSHALAVYGDLSKFIHGQKEDTMQLDNYSMKLVYSKGRFCRSKDYLFRVVSVVNIALSIRFWIELHASSPMMKTVSSLIEDNEVIKL